MTQRLEKLLLGCLLLGVLGCGSGGDGPQLYPVSGTVTLDGAPLASGNILFKDPERKTQSYPANIKEGAFQTQMEAGKRQVLITAIRQSPNKMVPNAEGTGQVPATEQYIPAQYNEKTTLEIEVDPSKDNQVEFNLTSQ